MENWYTRGILLWHDVILENWLHTRHPQASRILSLIVTKSMLNAKIIALKRLLLTHAMTINRSHQGSCLGHSKHRFKEDSIVKRLAFQRVYSNFVEDQGARRSSLCNFGQNHRRSVIMCFFHSTRVSNLLPHQIRHHFVKIQRTQGNPLNHSRKM